MFAVSFDMVIEDLERHHPTGPAQAYAQIKAELGKFGFQRIQGSVYLGEQDDLVTITRAMQALKAMPWFGQCVRDIRAFRVENFSDFTRYFKD